MGALRCTGGATGTGTWQGGQEDRHRLVGSFGADRLQHPRPAHICQTGRIVVVPGLPLPMSLASRSGIHPCHQRSDAIFRQRRHSDAGSRQRIGRQFEPAALRVLAAAEAMLVYLRGGRLRTA